MSLRNLLRLLLLSLFFLSPPLEAALSIGVGRTEITPPIGTPSAGYFAPERTMEGVRDPLFATALVIDNGEKRIALCAVDHLGFDHGMVEEIRNQFPEMQVLIASSHTHSGAGAYLNWPLIGEMLAGPYDPKIRNMLINQTIKAIQLGEANLQEGKIGFGYGHAPQLSYFRSSWPEGVTPPDDLSLIKCVSKEGKTIALLFNYATHPTVLSAKNTLYSADFVGYARGKIEEREGGIALYFNGAQGDVGPNPPLEGGTEFEKCCRLGEALADSVLSIADQITLVDECSISLVCYPYEFEIKATSTGMKLPLSTYTSELNLLVLNQSHAFVTIPGELSCLFVEQIRSGSPFSHTSIFGLTNDAHGYILTPGAFDHRTKESELSFGGRDYGDWVVKQLLWLLQTTALPQSQGLCLQRL